MYSNIGLYSYGTACLAYALLAATLLLVWRDRWLSLSAILATVITAAWAGVIAAATLLPYPPVVFLQTAEVSRNAAWLFLLLAIYGARLRGAGHVPGSRSWLSGYLAALAAVIVIVFASPIVGRIAGVPEPLVQALVYSIWLSMSLMGLWLLENIYRNSPEIERWWLKYLCLGLGFLFAYDFFMYAGALILQHRDTALWQARGFAIAFTAPLVAVAAARSHGRRARTQLSQHRVFHTFTLLAAGVYLISMAVVAYFVSYLGDTTWSAVLQITFLAATGLFLLVLLLSRRVRAISRVWLSKNFFSYKYDYRREWMDFIDTLVEGAEDTPQAVIQSMAKLGRCHAGALWGRSEDGRFHLEAEWPKAMSDSSDDFPALARWLQDTGWIIDLDEWRESPELYRGLEMPEKLVAAPGAWIIIPLMFGKRLDGILFLHRSKSYAKLNWEDLDLLKLAGRQAASYLEQYKANQSLVELRQFEAFNRLSAYVVHDLKNLLAEQSLIVSNAAQHRGNQAFYDDVIATVNDSVERMTRLMAQMKSGVRGGELQAIELGALLREVVSAFNETLPLPTLECTDSEQWVSAHREQLANVFHHLIQNAGEATDKRGRIRVRLSHEGECAVVEIEDNGAGMSQEFIKDRLFKPFDSTKGLTGMGIGAFESRELLHSLGGSIEVRSEEGAGSFFRIVLPCRVGTLYESRNL